MRCFYWPFGLLLASIAFFGCAASFSNPASRDFPVVGNVSSISRSDLTAAIVAADAKRVYRVRVINRDRVRVDVSDDVHYGPDYEHPGRSVRFHGEPAYIIVTRVRGHWQSAGAFISTY